MKTKERKTRWSDQTYTRTLRIEALKWGKRPVIDPDGIKYRGQDWDYDNLPGLDVIGQELHFEARERTPEDGTQWIDLYHLANALDVSQGYVYKLIKSKGMATLTYGKYLIPRPYPENRSRNPETGEFDGQTLVALDSVLRVLKDLIRGQNVVSIRRHDGLLHIKLLKPAFAVDTLKRKDDYWRHDSSCGEEISIERALAFAIHTAKADEEIPLTYRPLVEA